MGQYQGWGNVRGGDNARSMGRARSGVGKVGAGVKDRGGALVSGWDGVGM